MSDATEKPTKEDIAKIRSRLIFLKYKSNFLIIPYVLAYISAYIALVIFDQTQHIPSIVALALLNSIASIDRFDSFIDEYKVIDKGVNDV